MSYADEDKAGRMVSKEKRPKRFVCFTQLNRRLPEVILNVSERNLVIYF